VLVVIDDIDPLLPDLADNVTADHGSTQQTGNPTGVIYSGGAGDPGDPITGQGPGIGVGDHALSHSTVVFLEPEIGLGEGADELPPRPTFLSYTPNDFGIEVQLAELPELAYDKVQIYGSIDNDRHNATQMFSGRGSLIQIPFDNIRTRWLWARTIQGARESEWSSDADDGFQTTGGAPYREFTTWLETFDAYSSREDFEREWEILSGDPTISFSPVGINGSNVLHVQGAMYAMHRRPVPYDYTKLYECSTRFRAATHEAGNESLSVGFLGETATTLVDSQGNSGTFAPTNAVLNACDLANFPDWQRAIGWITGSEQVLLSALPLHLPLNYLISPWRPSHIHSLNGVTPERCSYIRPTLMCNFPAGTTATCQIDYVEVRRVDSDIGIGELADGNFAAADDHEYWAQVGFAWDAQLAVGAGLAGGNAILFDVDGTVPNNQIAIISRNAMTMTNNITVAVQYIIENAVSIGSQVRLTLAAVPLVLSGEMPRHYEPGAGTAPTANVLINTLDDSGNVAQTTLSISNIFANSTLQAADYFHLWIMIELPEASDDFDFYMVRARIARS
jgi:hypothetical protein